jgi:GTPase SAR1 family protein
MTYTAEPTNFLQDLDRIARTRQTVAGNLANMAQALKEGETDGLKASGQLGLEREIEDLSIASQNLRQGVFRLLVLGDMKRGKSTFLNALIGENLLPSDVNPCTALLTILRYGPEKRVTVHFSDGQPPETIDFQLFKQRYTINPEEAKILEQNKQQAFPNVSHAVVEYPLPLLEKRIEIVDSPGLNDTEARNELSLGYIHNCHAILFVLRASQPCTLAERRYLENYIKDRGLSIFFLINAWDQVKESLIDPDDTQELQESEAKLRKVFRANLADYCWVDGHDLYDERVFEISAIQALRQRLKDPAAELAGTGFPKFVAALNLFLTQERAIAELRQARTLSRQAQGRVREALDRRIPLLDQTVTELKQRLQSVEPQFAQLSDIRDQFQADIRTTRDRKARSIADSFRTYVLGLEHTVEQDFLRYQPPTLQFLDFLNQNKREDFVAAATLAFQQYANDKFFAWTLNAERELGEAFNQLSQKAAQYGSSYAGITQAITEKLTGGQPLRTPISQAIEDDDSPGWAKWAMGFFSLATGNFAGAALAVAGFDFKSILLNLFTSGGIAIVASSLFGIMLGPIGLALIGLGVGLLQADHARKEFAKAVQRELVKHLPQVAQEQWQPIYTAVQECFETYEHEVIQRMNDDMTSRKAELDNLLNQKQTSEIDRDNEIQRLQNLEQTIVAEAQQLEQSYQNLLTAFS